MRKQNGDGGRETSPEHTKQSAAPKLWMEKVNDDEFGLGGDGQEVPLFDLCVKE